MKFTAWRIFLFLRLAFYGFCGLRFYQLSQYAAHHRRDFPKSTETSMITTMVVILAVLECHRAGCRIHL